MIEGGMDELPGISVFYRDENGDIFHTYSSYARGGDILLGAYNYFDLTPKGRNEQAIMDWLRRHDEYADAASACCGSAAGQSVARDNAALSTRGDKLSLLASLSSSKSGGLLPLHRLILASAFMKRSADRTERKQGECAPCRMSMVSSCRCRRRTWTRISAWPGRPERSSASMARSG